MKKNLETLIQELCPDGVEFKPIWELTAWDKKFNGVDKKWQQKIVSYPYVLAKVFDDIEDNTGNIKLLSTGIVDKDRWTTEEKAGENLCEGEIVAIPWGGTPNVKYYKGKFVTADNRIATSLDTSILDNKFLYYWLSNNIKKIAKLYRGAGIQHPSMKGVLSLEIPLPPLEVQTEIVRILDKFTSLEAELEAELDCRKRQYEYYRDKLLSFENLGGQEVAWKKMSEVCVNCDSKRKAVTGAKRESGNIPYYGASGIVDYVKDYIFDGDFLLVSEDGANLLARNTPIAFSIKGKNWVNNHAHVLKFDNLVSQKFVEYYLNSISLSTWISGAAQPKLNQENLNRIPIPVPSLEEQQRIVSILDRFESLTTSLQSGLPAEIAARRQQYEYYRDKLLTFKRKAS